MIIKVIKNIILINLFCGLCLACTSSRSGELEKANSELPLQEGKSKMPVLMPEGEADLSVLPPSVDPDQDNVPDVKYKEGVILDNCPGVFNPDQQDSDGDGIGDACEK